MQDGILSAIDQKGILSGVDKIIADIFGVTSNGKAIHYSRKTACNQVNRSPLQNVAANLLTRVYDQIKYNWKTRPYKKPPSKENWRFEPKLKINMRSLEIRLQRAIVNINLNMWPDAKNWTNHVPTASGLWDHKCDKHRAIDLVHLRSGRNRYDTLEFIELKVDTRSGHPVYAAMEVLLYGMLYIFSRRHLKKLNYDVTKQPLLQAKAIHLVVLAPFNYYDGYRFDWLEKAITTGLKKSQKLEGYTMDFKFQAFPRGCSTETIISDKALLIEALKGRERVKSILPQW